MKKIIKVLIIGIIIISIGSLGYIYGKKSTRNNVCPSVNSNNNYQAGWNAFRERLINSGYFSLNNGEMKSLSGIITAVNRNEINTKIITIDPLADPDLDNRTIIISEGTTLTKTVKKDEKLYNSEMKEALKNKDNLRPDSPNNMPTMFTNESATIGDLQINEKIIITSEENIKDLKKINAKEIIIQQ